LKINNQEVKNTNINSVNNFFKVLSALFKLHKIGLKYYFTPYLIDLESLQYLDEEGKYSEKYLFWVNSHITKKNSLAKVVASDEFERFELIFALIYANKHSFNINNLTNPFSYFFNEEEDLFMYQTYGARFGKFCFWKTVHLLRFINKFLRYWVLAATLAVSLVYFSLVVKALPFTKVMFEWTVIFMLVYWLISGFVFFVKKYQYGKFTSVVQRFWRRSFILFWLLESFLLLVFVFLTFNSSQELFWMFDQTQLYKNHLFSWRLFLLKILPLGFLIVATFILILTIKWSYISKYLFLAMIITAVLTYIVWLEFYQFFYICNYYGLLNWVYDPSERIWDLEIEVRKTRIVHHYVNLLFILKFWHVLFVFAFWIFFLLRANESDRIRYPLLSANLQNFVFLYVLTWVYMYPWFKLFYRQYFDIVYKWFYTGNRSMFVRMFFNDIKLVLIGIYCFIEQTVFNLTNGLTYSYKHSPFVYWYSYNSKAYGASHFNKGIIRNEIINDLFSYYVYADNYLNNNVVFVSDEIFQILV